MKYTLTLPRRRIAGKWLNLAKRQGFINTRKKPRVIPKCIIAFQQQLLLKELETFLKKHNPLDKNGFSLRTLNVARNNVSFMTAQELDNTCEGIVLALKAAKVGKLTFQGWVMLHTSLCVAYAIENAGYVKGLLPLLDPTAEALKAIRERCDNAGQWEPKACRGTELTAITEFISCHRFQLMNCTLKEISTISTKLKRQSLAKGGAVDPRANFHLGTALAALRNNYNNVEVHIPNFVEA